MKASTERLLVVGIVLSGIIALFAKSAGAAELAPPASFHPELTPLERAFVWTEVENNTAEAMLAKAPTYEGTVLADGSHLSALAKAALAAEAVAKMTPGQVASHAP